MDSRSNKARLLVRVFEYVLMLGVFPVLFFYLGQYYQETADVTSFAKVLQTANSFRNTAQATEKPVLGAVPVEVSATAAKQKPAPKQSAEVKQKNALAPSAPAAPVPKTIETIPAPAAPVPSAPAGGGLPVSRSYLSAGQSYSFTIYKTPGKDTCSFALYNKTSQPVDTSAFLKANSLPCSMEANELKSGFQKWLDDENFSIEIDGKMLQINVPKRAVTSQ